MCKKGTYSRIHIAHGAQVPDSLRLSEHHAQWTLVNEIVLRHRKHQDAVYVMCLWAFFKGEMGVSG